MRPGLFDMNLSKNLQSIGRRQTGLILTYIVGGLSAQQRVFIGRPVKDSHIGVQRKLWPHRIPLTGVAQYNGDVGRRVQI